MSNVTKITGQENLPKEKEIKDMEIGEVGYTVPWALEEDNLKLHYPISEKGGTASTRVTRTGPDTFEVHFEKPEYRRWK